MMEENRDACSLHLDTLSIDYKVIFYLKAIRCMCVLYCIWKMSCLTKERFCSGGYLYTTLLLYLVY